MYQATDKDRALARQIIREEFEVRELQISDEAVEIKVNEILNISYSIGGGYDQSTLREIVKAILNKKNK